MKNKVIILKWSLFLGGVYFILISIVHIFGIKIPGLYIYFNLPSYAYQDKIVSFLAIGWGIFFIQVSRNPTKYIDLVKSILFAGLAAISGLIFINLSTNFDDLSQNLNVLYYWIQLFILCLYLLWLFIFYKQIISDIHPKTPADKND
jgi:hypothetical protein